MNYFSKIIGTGSAFPERIMTNHDFENFVETSDEWIRTRTGIQTRRIADHSKGEFTSTLALKAARNAIEMANIPADQIELIIIGTVTPDSLMPTTANLIQAALGATKAFSFDLQSACSGFLYGLSIADQYIRTGMVKTALVIGAETLSTLINWQDRGTCVLFGDGAGAALLTRTTETNHSILGTKLYSDGSKGDILKIPHGGSKYPHYLPEYQHKLHSIHMQGSEVFKLAVRNMIDASLAVLSDHGLTPEDVDYFFFHQANMRILDMCMKTLKVPKEKTWINLDKYGNTSAATLPVCLDEAWRAKVIKPGDLILMATFGGGVTWASGLIRL
ncbi:MAG: ketoacyl-ACP synthase III [Proteobacteria bacterium]|nr:ketoacyl-ACP synthase III [Pseudomonadota bacterium]